MLRSATLRTFSLARTSLRATSSTRVLRPIPAQSYIWHRSLNTAAGDAARKELSKRLVDWDGPKLTYEQVKSRTQQPSPDAYLIDVREPDEVIQGSIPSSVNLPLSTLSTDLHLDRGSFLKKLGFEKPTMNQEIVFYCRSGKRSATACDVAKKNGFTNVINYEGSWLDWTEKEQGAK